MFGKFKGGKPLRGAPKMAWQKNLESDCEMSGIGYGKWCDQAKDRSKWHNKIAHLTSVKKKKDPYYYISLIKNVIE